MPTIASPQQLQQLIDAYNGFRGTLPQDYSPSHYFAGMDNGLYVFPASQWDPATQSPLHTVPWAEGEVDPRAGGTQLPDDPRQSALWQDPNFQRAWQDYQLRTALSYGGSQANDDFQGFVANVFGNSFTLPAAFAGGAMGANAAGNLGVQAGTSGVNLTQNPSGGGAGGTAGTLLGAATGIPGAATVGGIAGGLAGGALAAGLSSGGGDSAPSTPATSNPGGTTGMATPPALIGQPGTQPTLDAEQILAQLRGLGVEGLPGRAGLQGAALDEARRAANASPQQLLTGLRSQIAQLRQGLQTQFSQASRSLGPAGSKLIAGEQGKALATAGGKLSDLFAQAGSAGQSGLLGFLQGTKPSLLAKVPEPVTSVSTGAPDFTGLAAALKGGSSLYNTLKGTNDWTNALA